jgi:hypothetical protein
MADTPDLEVVAAFARGAGLDHNRERLSELAPEVARLSAAMRALWSIDVRGHEMAVGLAPAARMPRSHE